MDQYVRKLPLRETVSEGKRKKPAQKGDQKPIAQQNVPVLLPSIKGLILNPPLRDGDPYCSGDAEITPDSRVKRPTLCNNSEQAQILGWAAAV
jgi:hypothetical protein